MKEESNAAMDACMKDWEDLSAEYLVRVLDAHQILSIIYPITLI